MARHRLLYYSVQNSSWILHWNTFPFPNQEQRVEYLSRKLQRYISLIYSTLHHNLKRMLYAGSLAFFPNWTGKHQASSLLASIFYKTLPKRRSSMLPLLRISYKSLQRCCTTKTLTPTMWIPTCTAIEEGDLGNLSPSGCVLQASALLPGCEADGQ